ncbi:LOW QUALITY PROTEIN: uncharacterized protein C2orf81 homolog [Aptenodytes patagonicus]|uniref:LOW QUALITY PROTEIN: uncharacterized protein C2orf81 homolog n=1 Tax=Aptenodytes patagonicus TaxID=9234 RepID=UPI003FA0C09F
MTRAGGAAGAGAGVAVETGTPPASGGGEMAEKTTPRERAAPSKGTGEKSQPPTPAAARAGLVPGRLPRAEWLSVLAAERAEGEAGDILAELWSLPFALGRARDALLRIVRWRFPARDEGETGPEGDGAWREDEEPQPRHPDSWAQGSVPVLRLRPSPRPAEVSGARDPRQRGKQDTPAAAEAGGPPVPPLRPGQVPATGAVLPVPGPSRPELLLDEVDIPPGPPDGKSPCPAPAASASPALPGQATGTLPAPGPSRAPGAAGGGTASATVIPRGRGGERCGGGQQPQAAAAASLLHQPGKDPARDGPARHGGEARGVWHRPGGPQAGLRQPSRALDQAPGGGAGPGCGGQAAGVSPGCPLAQPGAGAGQLAVAPGAGHRGGGTAPAAPPGVPAAPSPVPWQLGSLLDSARLAPGVTIRQGGSVKHGLCIPAHGEEEEEEEEEEETTGEAKRDLRPIRPDVPFPAIAARQVTGDGER